jgi:molybdate transport system ATP-binding protein
MNLNAMSLQETENTIRLSLARPEFMLDVDLALPARGITVLFGASGSGKTTLLRCVAGLERAPNALVQIAGEVWQDERVGVFLPVWRRPLGYVFQEASLFDHLDVRGNLDYGLKRASGAAPWSAAPGELLAARDAAVELLGIGALLNRRTHQLSGGAGAGPGQGGGAGGPGAVQPGRPGGAGRRCRCAD